MNPSVRSSSIALLALCLSPTLTATALAASNTLKYTYDALGRLTFVEDAVNGNRDYDYDRAGNRTSVSTGVDSDIPPKLPVPSVPTGLRTYENHAPGVYTSTWNAVSGANYYLYSNSIYSTEYTVTGTSYTATGRGHRLRACNQNGCSDWAYF